MKISNAMRVAGFGVCAMLGLSGAATAATLSTTFDFTTASTGWQSSLGYSSDGVDLTVTGTSGGSGSYVATWSGYGMGVGYYGDNSHQVDSYGPDDLVSLAFSQDVRITNITFNSYYSQSWDTFQLTEEGALAFEGNADPSVDVTTGLADSFGIGAVGREFLWTYGYYGYAVTDYGGRYMCSKDDYYYDRYGKKVRGYDCYSGFKITGITVEWDMPEVIPLPAAGWLLLGGIGGLAALRRRRKAA
jgi:hypothetical protein